MRGTACLLLLTTLIGRGNSECVHGVSNYYGNCVCEEGWAGPACDKCSNGWAGPNCDQCAIATHKVCDAMGRKPCGKEGCTPRPYYMDIDEHDTFWVWVRDNVVTNLMGGPQDCSGVIETCGACKHGWGILTLDAATDMWSLSDESGPSNDKSCSYFCSRHVACASAIVCLVLGIVICITACTLCSIGKTNREFTPTSTIRNRESETTPVHSQGPRTAALALNMRSKQERDEDQARYLMKVWQDDKKKK